MNNKNIRIRNDGRVLHDMHLFQVKSPDESNGPFDLYRRLATIPGEEADRPLGERNCPLVNQ
ncbi:hypothetical protein [Bradyrhizobium sp. USDA 4502]